MMIRIDVVYSDGEVVGFRNQNQYHKSPPVCTLVRGLKSSMQFRFCNPDGGAEQIVEPDGARQVQILLSSRDRVLAMEEKNITLQLDEDGFQLLEVDDLDIDTTEMQNCLNDSYLEDSPDMRGKVDCELSVAILALNDNCRMQLFFTFPVTVKNQLAV